MDIKEPKFNIVDIEISETFIDDEGRTKERRRKASFPMGKERDAKDSSAEIPGDSDSNGSK